MIAAIVERLSVVVGAGLIVYGASMLSYPVALILAGAFLLAGALWRIRK